MSVYYVKVSDNRVKFPNYCPCCGDATDLGTHDINYSVTDLHSHKTLTVNVDVPYCNHCIKHGEKCNSPIKYIGIIPLVLSFVFPLGNVFWDAGFGRIALIIGAIILGIALFFIFSIKNEEKAKAMTKGNCITENWAIKLNQPNEFLIYNKGYAESFASLNNSSVREA